MRSDEALMEQVQAGEDAALGALMTRYKGPLYGFLNRRVGPSAADDLFQDTWIRVVRARDRFDPRRRFSTWMFQIANNLCRDRWRRLEVERRALGEVNRTREAGRETRSRDVPSDLARDMRTRLDALPERLREVLILRYYHDLGEREISEALSIPRGTVKSRIHAAVKTLREQERAEHPQEDQPAQEQPDAEASHS